MAKNQIIQQVILFRVTAAVTAENLPYVHSVLASAGSVTSIEKWYDEPQTSTLPIGEAESSNETDLLVAGEQPAGKVKGGQTLIEQILHHAKREGGVTRKELKDIAAQYGFNVGSVSPTLVKLVKDRKVKRIGKGVYAFRH
jgi:hypothetical protein